MQIVYFLIFFWGGLFFGVFIVGWLIKNRSWDGIIIVKKEDGKIIYSLELTSNPEQLQYEKEVLFKVLTVDEDDRE